MSKNKEREILDALNESHRATADRRARRLNESRRARASRRSRRLNEAFEDDLGDVEVVDVVAHVKDSYVGEDPVDPDYDQPNIHPVSQIDPMGDVEGVIDDLDNAEPALFDVEVDYEDDVDGDYDDDFDDTGDDFDDDEDDYDFDDTEGDEIVDIEFLDDADEAVRTKFQKKVSNAGGHRHVVTAAAQKRRAKSKKAGSNYKVLANGKKVRKTRAEKRRERSAQTQRNLHSASSQAKARKRRSKTMKARKESIASSNWTNEQAFMTLLNGVLADARRKSGGRLRESRVLGVRKGTVRGNSIVMECVVRDGRGSRRRANITITGRPRGRYEVTESAHILPKGVRIGGSYRMRDGRFVFENMRYTMKARNGRTINEGFKVVND